MSQSLVTAERPALRFFVKLVIAVGILTVSAKVTIPFWPVPMTMQVAAVLLIAGLGGMKFGSASVMAYLATGAAGLPVFAGTPEKGIGLAYMVGPTGGYLVGFLVAAALVGWAADRFGKYYAAAAMPVGLAIIFALGVAWLARFVPADQVLAYGLTPFLFGGACKVALAAILTIKAPTAVRRWIKG